MITGIIIGVLAASVLLCLYFIPKIKHTHEIDKNIIYQNQLQENKLKELQQQSSDLVNEISDRTQELSDIVNKNNELMADAEQRANAYYTHHMQLATDRFSTDLEIAERAYDDAVAAYDKEYQTMVAESVADMTNIINGRKQEISLLDEELISNFALLESKREEIKNINESLKILQAEKEQQDFYKLQLTTDDVKEIKILNDVVPYLRDGEPVYKIIWKVYYEKPYNDLIGRVVGSGKHCGIYKLTNTTNGMAYVGQSVDISDRWKTHIKSGLGIGGSKNKLYLAMMKYGVENFTFEILEECERSLLNEREKQ